MCTVHTLAPLMFLAPLNWIYNKQRKATGVVSDLRQDVLTVLGGSYFLVELQPDVIEGWAASDEMG